MMLWSSGSPTSAEGGKGSLDIMGKGRDKRRRKVKKQTLREAVAHRVRVSEIRAIEKAVLAKLSGSDPPILGEPDAPVHAPVKPKPNLRSGAIALPQPEPEDAFVTLEPKRISK